MKFLPKSWVLPNDPRSNTLSHELIALVLEVFGFYPFKSHLLHVQLGLRLSEATYVGWTSLRWVQI